MQMLRAAALFLGILLAAPAFATCVNGTSIGEPDGSVSICHSNNRATVQVPGPSLSLYNSNPYYTCGSNFYVTTGASGSGDGSLGNPWTLAQAVAATLSAGSCVNLTAGTYTLSGVNPLSFTHGGTAPSVGASFPATTYVVWRCLTMPFGFSSGVFQGEGGANSCHFIQSGTNGGNLVSGLVSYIMFDGIEFDGNGDLVQSSCIDDESSSGGHHHIWFFNSDIHGCGQSGIQINHTDWIYVIHNYWHDNSQTNGVDGSGVSFYEPTLTAAYTQTTQDGSFTSTTAGVTFHIVTNYNVGIHNYNNFANCTDGEGIIFDDWGWNQNAGTTYAGNGLAMGNVMYFNGGGGIEVFSQKAAVGHIWVVNNTAYNNYWSSCNAGTFRGDFYNNNTFNMTEINNVGYTVGGAGVLADIVPFMGHCSTCGSNLWQTDIGFGATSLGTFDSPNTFPTSGVNHNLDNTSDPKFVSITAGATSGNNFALQAGSPAIGFGQAFDLWQQTGTVDAGACVSSLTNCP